MLAVISVISFVLAGCNIDETSSNSAVMNKTSDSDTKDADAVSKKVDKLFQAADAFFEHK